MDNLDITLCDSIKNIYKTSKPDCIRDKLSKVITSSTAEKNNYEEYPTPPKLVDQIINKLPTDLFTKPHKFFEPTCGKGNILLGIFDRLFINLECYCSDPIDRCRIIMENCLYFSDINRNNILIVNEILHNHAQNYCGIRLDYKLNYYCGNTLEIDIHELWNIEQFDCIISNPPFTVQQNNVSKRGGGNSLWKKFLLKSINEWLISDGYLSMIHPNGWRKPCSPGSKYNGIFKLLTQDNQLIYLNMNDGKECTKIFNCKTNFDWYVLHKREKYKSTDINDWKQNNINIDMSLWEFLPNYNIDKISKLIGGINDEKCNILYDRSKYGGEQKWTSSKQDDVFIYKIVHNTSKKGVTFHYSSRNDNGHFGIPKVIFGDSGIHNSVLDINGEYGMTHHSMGIVDSKENLPMIKKAIDSPNFKDILKYCSWSTYQIDWRLFLYFKKDFWKFI